MAEGERAGDGGEVDAVLGAAGEVDLTVVEVATRVAERLVETGAVAGLVVAVVAEGPAVGGVAVTAAVVVLSGRVTNAKGVGVGGRDTPSGCNSSYKIEMEKWTLGIMYVVKMMHSQSSV